MNELTKKKRFLMASFTSQNKTCAIRYAAFVKSPDTIFFKYKYINNSMDVNDEH